MDPDYFRCKAERCRLHAAVTAKPAVKEQLRVWAREFDQMADEVEDSGRPRAAVCRLEH